MERTFNGDLKHENRGLKAEEKWTSDQKEDAHQANGIDTTLISVQDRKFKLGPLPI